MNTSRLKSVFCLLSYCRNLCSGNFQRQIIWNYSLKADNNASSNCNLQEISHRQFSKVSQPQISYKLPGINLLCTVSSSKCWHCSSAFNKWERFCPDCSTIQPINSSLNYFNILGVEQEFSIDVPNLSKQFRALQAVYHPDKFSLKSKEEQELSAECSSSLNKGYRTLQHPMTRAEYLLDLAGRTLQEEEIILDQDFLMTIMELNEELSAAEGKEAVQELGRKNKQTLDALLREADEAFQQSDMNRARDVVARLKYYENIYNKVRDYEREHGIVD